MSSHRVVLGTRGESDTEGVKNICNFIHSVLYGLIKILDNILCLDFVISAGFDPLTSYVKKESEFSNHNSFQILGDI